MGAVLLGTVVYWQAGNLAALMATDPAAISALTKTFVYFGLILIGFCIYGPVALVTIQAVNLVPKNATGTAAGFVGIFGYLVGDSLLSKIIVGSVADYSWNAANLTMVIGAALGVVLCILTIKSEKA